MLKLTELEGHLGFKLTPVHERKNIELLLSCIKEFHDTNILAALLKRSALCRLSKSDAVWHVNVPKCRREVQITARLKTPPLLLVCRVNTLRQELG